MARHYMHGRMHDKNTMYEIARGLRCALLQIKDTGSLTCLHKVSKTDDLAICLNSTAVSVPLNVLRGSHATQIVCVTQQVL